MVRVAPVAGAPPCAAGAVDAGGLPRVGPGAGGGAPGPAPARAKAGRSRWRATPSRCRSPRWRSAAPYVWAGTEHGLRRWRVAGKPPASASGAAAADTDADAEAIGTRDRPSRPSHRRAGRRRRLRCLGRHRGRASAASADKGGRLHYEWCGSAAAGSRCWRRRSANSRRLGRRRERAVIATTGARWVGVRFPARRRGDVAGARRGRPIGLGRHARARAVSGRRRRGAGRSWRPATAAPPRRWSAWRAAPAGARVVATRVRRQRRPHHAHHQRRHRGVPNAIGRGVHFVRLVAAGAHRSCSPARRAASERPTSCGRCRAASLPPPAAFRLVSTRKGSTGTLSGGADGAGGAARGHGRRSSGSGSGTSGDGRRRGRNRSWCGVAHDGRRARRSRRARAICRAISPTTPIACRSPAPRTDRCLVVAGGAHAWFFDGAGFRETRVGEGAPGRALAVVRTRGRDLRRRDRSAVPDRPDRAPGVHRRGPAARQRLAGDREGAVAPAPTPMTTMTTAKGVEGSRPSRLVRDVRAQRQALARRGRGRARRAGAGTGRARDRARASGVAVGHSGARAHRAPRRRCRAGSGERRRACRCRTISPACSSTARRPGSRRAAGSIACRSRSCVTGARTSTWTARSASASPRAATERSGRRRRGASGRFDGTEWRFAGDGDAAAPATRAWCTTAVAACGWRRRKGLRVLDAAEAGAPGSGVGRTGDGELIVDDDMLDSHASIASGASGRSATRRSRSSNHRRNSGGATPASTSAPTETQVRQQVGQGEKRTAHIFAVRRWSLPISRQSLLVCFCERQSRRPCRGRTRKSPTSYRCCRFAIWSSSRT